MKKAVLLTCLILFTQASHGKHIGDVTIKKIRVFDNRAVIETNETINKAECATVDNHVTVLLTDPSVANRRLSVLLAAHAQNKIFNPNCTSSCDDSFQSWLGRITICDEVSIR